MTPSEMPDENELNAVEKIYLRHQSQHLLQSTARKLPFLGFFITLNIAFYTGIYALEPQNLWAISALRIILIFLLIVINTVSSMIFWREQAIDDLIRDGFYQFITPRLKHPALRTYDHTVESGDRANKGKTWKLINLMLSIFCAMPIAFLAVLFINLFDMPREMTAMIFSGSALLIAGIYYFKVP